MTGKRKRKGDAVALIEIECGWMGCNFTCSNDWAFNNHLGTHLKEYKLNMCPWVKCDFEGVTYDDLQRHVYYHGYYNGLLAQGKHIMATHCDLPSCTAAEREADKVPVLKHDFCCAWIDCDRKFQSIVEFQDHIVQHASFEYEISRSPDDQRPKIKCNWNYCRKQLDNKYRLIEHISTHSNRKQAACPNCGELFRTKTTLFDHLRRQPENNTHQFSCAECFKFFATEKLLRAHMVKHIHRFKCTMCNMTCYSSSALAIHFRYRHLNDRPFKCTQCDHSCVCSADLDRHMHFAHTKDMHHCGQAGCNYAVRSYASLRKHVWEVHGNAPSIYVCHCCDKAFKYGKSLSIHLIKKHDFQLPSGHKRFTYRVDEDGFYRVQIKRIESLDVTKQILSPNTFETSDMMQNSSCYEIVSMTNENEQRTIVSNDANEAHFVGEVIISLPTMQQQQE